MELLTEFALITDDVKECSGSTWTFPPIPHILGTVIILIATLCFVSQELFPVQPSMLGLTDCSVNSSKDHTLNVECDCQ